MSRRELTVLLAMVVIAAGVVSITMGSVSPDPDEVSCWRYDLGLMYAGALSSLLVTFLGATILAALGSSFSAYALLVVAASLVAGFGYAQGMEAECGGGASLGRALSAAGLGLIPALAGLVPGYILGRLVRALGGGGR